MHVFVFAIQKFFVMLFRLTDNSLNNFSPLLIVISNDIACSCFMYSRVSRDWSSMPAKLCNVKFVTAIRSCIDEPVTFGMANPFYISFVASRIYCSLQKVSPKNMHMLYKTKHVKTKSDTLFKCTSNIFKMIHHLSLSIQNARSIHMNVELWAKFQWYSSRERPSLWP